MAMSPADAKGPPRVLFLADCGAEVGGGHVMRCLSLAEALAGSGARCAMLATPAVTRVLDVFADQRLERASVAESSQEGLVEAGIAFADDWVADILVIDHYGLDHAQELALSNAVRAVVAMDDLADRPRHCQLLVDPTLGREAADYDGLIEPGTRVLAGPAYALLAPAYAAMRKSVLSQRRPQTPARRLLVSLGLMDLGGVTGRVLNLIMPLLAGMEVDVVVGAAAPSLAWLRSLEAREPGVRLHVDSRGMARLISMADIGIGAGGVSTWERAALGLPSVSLILADNQRSLALGLERRGASLAIEARGDGLTREAPQALERLLADGDLRQRMSEVSTALCDGRGAHRVAQAVLALAT
jgi:UDP-2,4-diacetamido-2,4,6-trideoxy-beta-L-altropyranose hydrolase